MARKGVLMENRNFSEKEIVGIGKSLIGKTFNELGYREWALKRGGGKGKLGEFAEESVFGYAMNSRHEADFAEAGIELKVTGVRRQEAKGLWTAKERLVLCMLNYLKDYVFVFRDSPMWRKSQRIFAIFYEYDDASKADYGSFRIVDARLLSFGEEDLAVIESDYGKIIKKIKDGVAEAITEGDTDYLAACTKGANLASIWTRQPFSDAPAKRRAWSYKPTLKPPTPANSSTTVFSMVVFLPDYYIRLALAIQDRTHP
jgi:DNA mismatch repair protein MutH